MKSEKTGGRDERKNWLAGFSTCRFLDWKEGWSFDVGVLVQFDHRTASR